MRCRIALCLVFGAFVAHAQPEIDLHQGWRFKTDPNDEGTSAGWMRADLEDTDWQPIRVGTRWEDDGHRDYDGAAWYRIRVDVPAGWVSPSTHLFVSGINDAGTVYCNGVKIDDFGDDARLTMYQTRCIALLGDHLKPGATNVIAIRVFDWGGGGGLWRTPIQLRQSLTSEAAAGLVELWSRPQDNTIAASVLTEALGSAAMDAPVTLTMSGHGVPDETKRLVGSEIARFRTLATNIDALISLNIDIPGGKVLSARFPYRAPGPSLESAGFGKALPLNNFVAVLFGDDKGRAKKLEGTSEFRTRFAIPREGWVSIQVRPADANIPSVRVVDTIDFPRLRRPNADAPWEAMCFLPEGSFDVAVTGAKDLRIALIPEIAFCYFPVSLNVDAFGPLSRDVVENDILANVNTLVGGAANAEVDAVFSDWRAEGRRWIATGSVLGLKSITPPEPRAVTDAWLQNPGISRPGFNGLIVDEFTTETDAHYRAWTESIALLRESPAMKDRQFYAWCVDLFRDEGPLAFSRRLHELGFVHAWENYIREEPNLMGAERLVNRSLGQWMEEWQRVVPGIERSMVVCLGYFTAPSFTLDVDPGADYNVLLDMQFNALANDPRFRGLRGVMEFISNNADEEYLRYVQKLYRHYCIEGNTERYNADPYELRHLRNPDFADGLDEWTIEPASDGSVRAGSMNGFSFLEGRYPRYKAGDQFCVMSRGSDRENRVTQKLDGLTPGRLYSLKMYSATTNALQENAATGLLISFDNVEVIDAYTIDYAYASGNSNAVPPYNSNKPAHLTFHRRVFRATSNSANIAFTDASALPGRDTAFNFVQVQPYHAE
ncbi:MAG TPA: hypothetical protein PLJ47_01610 [Candidatus Hydrogenedentes bacterium]|nr:hypothetical protein [Candidatus Hydrogenedentota bacterium]HRK33262.1 hypothetical protein [Candidatus Hydrogenedentota bacterium]